MSLISLEKEIILNGTKKRYDIVVYDQQLQPVIIVECKAPEIQLTEQVLEQALRYDLVLNGQYVMITNGLVDHVFQQKKRLQNLPAYNELGNSN